jgi:RNA polymerase sigma-70 factor (ECF subfamily)
MTTAQYNEGVDQFADRVYRFILKQVQDSELARDVVQDTFEKLWRKVEDVQFEKIKSYLFTTAYHTMIDVIRREKKKDKYNEKAFRQLEDSNKGYTGLNEALHKALEQLPEIQRTVILLRDYEGYAYDEIGEITNLSETQVKVYIFRGRQTLRTIIGSMEAVL